MFKLIMVDDENSTIDIIKEVIDFNSYGFELSATFTNGAAAFDYIKQNHVDAVITDIKMPILTGIDLVTAIREINSEIEILFLTAYSEFEYASFGIDNNIFKYVLKPITIQSFTDVLTSLKNHLLQKPEQYNSVFSNYISPKLQKAFYDYIYGDNSLPFDELQGMLLKHNFDYDLKNSYMTVLDIDFIEYSSFTSNTEDSDKTLRVIKNLMCRDNILVCPLIYTTSSIKALLISKTNDKAKFINVLNDFKTSFTYDLAEIINMQATITNQGLFIDILRLKEYNDVYAAAHYDAEYLMNLITNNVDLSYVLNFFNINRSKNQNNENYGQIYAYTIYKIISTYIEPKDFIKLKLYGNDIHSPLLLDEFEMPVQINLIIEQLPKTIEAFFSYFNTNIKSNTNAVQQAIEYIQENYDKNISLDSVAKYVYRNPAYLSRSIKETTGMSFTDFLNNIRISKAKERLLSTEESVYTIASSVGYNSIGYFHKKFKEITGYTANSYRQTFLANKD